jgi:predicted amidohydrolase
MKANRTNADAFAKCNAIVIISPLLALVLMHRVTSAAELQWGMNQGFLTLSWYVPEAKLEEARGPLGPWQTVLATNSPYQLRPSTNLASRCGFYRLKMPAPGKKWLTVAAVTMTSQTNTAANLQTLYSYMELAASNKVDLVVFPEVALQGCPGWRENNVAPSAQEMAYIRATAEMIPGASTSNVVAKANELNLFVVFGMTEKDQAGLLYNANVFLGPDGVIGKHRKTYFVGNDALIWHVGAGYQVLDSPIGKLGLMICAEMYSGWNYPGPVLASQGADLLVTSSAWWNSVAWAWDLMTVTNAVLAGRWHVVSQQVGTIGYAQCYGHSRVVDPLGRIVCDSGASQGMVIWATDRVTDIRDP